MYESDCLLHMSRNCISFQGPFLCDGKIHRFSIDAKKNQLDEWYVAYSASMPTGQPYFCCIYGSWSDGSKFEYKSWEDSSNRVYYPPIDHKLLQAKIEENRRLVAIEQEKRHQESAKKAQEIWEHSSPIGSHTYLGKKKVQAYGVRLDTHSLREMFAVFNLSTKKEGNLKNDFCLAEKSKVTSIKLAKFVRIA